MNRRHFNASLLASGALLGWPSLGRADEQPLRLVIGFAAGGSTDTTARLVAEQMQKTLGRAVLVENRSGAAGRLAIQQVQQAAPDGNTLMIVPHGPMTVFPYIYKNLRFDPDKDFTPITRLVDFDYGLAASNQVTATDAASLARWIRADKTRAYYGSPGAGTVPHFIGVTVAHQLDVPMIHVPYRGARPSMVAIMGGEIPFAYAPLADATELATAGKLKILATSGAKRSVILPKTPTFQQFGIDFELQGWYAMYGPAGMAPAVAETLRRAATAAVNDPALGERLVKFGLTPAPSTGPELLALQQKERALWGPIVKTSGFTPTE